MVGSAMNNINKQYDLVVVGMGTAGAISSICAAKKGLKVLGVEYLSNVGGVGTVGGIRWYYYGSQGGYYETINSETLALQKKLYYEEINEHCSDLKGHLLEKAAISSGVEITFKTTVVDVYKENNKVIGLKLLKEGKFIDVFFKVVIDCTGDAVVALLSGCKTTAGRSVDGAYNPFSNVIITTTGKRNGAYNADSGYVDQYNNAELSQTIIQSLKESLNFYQKENREKKMLCNAKIFGVREGRKIVGEENLTLKDFLAGKKTEKPVFYSFTNLDTHTRQIAFEEEIAQEWFMCCQLWAEFVSVGIPAGALIPKDMDGLLVAGRSLAVDYSLASAVRMRRDMEKCGEVAAEMAILAINNNTSLKDVDTAQLQDILLKSQCLSEENNVGLLEKYKNITIEEILSDFATDNASVALWKARTFDISIESHLISGLTSENKVYAKNCASALALRGNNLGLNILRTAVKNRDPYISYCKYGYSFSFGIKSIYYLGKLADKDSVDMLVDILKGKGGYGELIRVAQGEFDSEEDLKFQYVSNALVALKRICEKHKDIKPQVDKQVREIFNGGNKYFSTLKANSFKLYDATEQILNYVKKFF